MFVTLICVGGKRGIVLVVVLVLVVESRAGVSGIELADRWSQRPSDWTLRTVVDKISIGRGGASWILEDEDDDEDEYETCWALRSEWSMTWN